MPREVSSSSSSVGIGFPGALGIAFIILKLCNIIDWSWFWVLSPFWITFVFTVLIFAGAFIYISRN